MVSVCFLNIALQKKGWEGKSEKLGQGKRAESDGNTVKPG
jgi:hypothetical protein